LLPQFLAPTLRHLATAPDAYAEGQTLYLDLTLRAQASLAFLVLALGIYLPLRLPVPLLRFTGIAFFFFLGGRPTLLPYVPGPIGMFSSLLDSSLQFYTGLVVLCVLCILVRLL